MISVLSSIDKKTDKVVFAYKTEKLLICFLSYALTIAAKSSIMKIVILTLLTLTLTSAQVFNGDDWKQVKSPLDSPHYQLIMSEMFPELNANGKINRGARIAGGQLATLGQFKHQALLLTVDSFGDTYVCGGSIISHNWILTVSW